MAQKPRRGRPPKPERLRKTQRLQVLVTGAEFMKLSKYAQQHDLTVSELVRVQVQSFLNRLEE